MDARDRRILQENAVFINKNMTVDGEFLDALSERGILTDSWREEIEAEKVNSKRIYLVISTLKRRGPMAFRGFIYALVASEQKHVADYLDLSLSNQYEAEYHDQMAAWREGPYRTSVQDTHGPKVISVQASKEEQDIPPVASTLHQPDAQPKPSSKFDTHEYFAQSFDEGDISGLDFTKTGIQNISVKPVTSIQMKKCFESPPQIVYKNNTSPRGRALVINNTEFDQPNLVRLGTNIDEVHMEELLKALGYKVKTKNDLTRDQMEDVLRKEAANQEHNRFDSFILVILTHGLEGRVMGKDLKYLSIDIIETLFDNQNCPALQGKPKLFFIQACQGDSYDAGVGKFDCQTEISIVQTEIAITQFNRLDIGSDAKSVPPAPDVTDSKVTPAFVELLPTKGDTLIAKAAYDGFRSWRNVDSGSWFIRAIVEVFGAYACQEEITGLMTRVNSKIAKTKTDTRKLPYKQMSTSNNSLTKKFYFFPGLSMPQ